MAKGMNWLRLIRFDEWQDTKLPLLALIVYQSYVGGQVARGFWEVFARSVLFGGALLAFGYLINDLADMESDCRSGKLREVMRLPRGVAVLICGALLALAVISLAPGLKQAPAGLLLLVSLAFAAFYSLPPLRLKERGAIGLYAAAAAQRSFPALAIAACWNSLSLGVAWMSVIFLLVGLRYILLHQAMDVANDRAAHVRTYLLERDHFRQLARLLGNVFLIELGAIALLPLLLGRSSYYLWLVIIPYVVYWAIRGQQNKRSIGMIHPVTYVDLPLQTFYFLAWPAALLGTLLLRQPAVWPVLLFEVVWKYRIGRTVQLGLRPSRHSEVR